MFHVPMKKDLKEKFKTQGENKRRENTVLELKMHQMGLKDQILQKTIERQKAGNLQAKLWRGEKILMKEKKKTRAPGPL